MVLKDIRPMYNAILVTANEVEWKEGKINAVTANSLKEYQTVVAVGNMVKEVKVGDVVMINPTKYAKNKYKDNSLNDGVTQVNRVLSYEFNVVMLNGKKHIMIYESDVAFIINDMDEDSDEVVEEAPKQHKKSKDLILPNKPKFIV